MKLGLHDLKPTGNYLNRRYIYEQDFPNNSNPQEGYDYIDKVITAQHMKDFPQLYTKEGKPKFYPQVIDYQVEEPEQVIQKEPKLTGFAHWESEINKCTKIENTSPIILDGLESLRTISDMNPKLKEVFNTKLEQLKNKV